MSKGGALRRLHRPPTAPTQRPQAWAQCRWCEKWRRVPVVLDSSDEFHCADCTQQEDHMASDEEVGVPPYAGTQLRARHSSTCSAQCRAAVSMPLSPATDLTEPTRSVFMPVLVFSYRCLFPQIAGESSPRNACLISSAAPRSLHPGDWCLEEVLAPQMAPWQLCCGRRQNVPGMQGTGTQSWWQQRKCPMRQLGRR